jgi:hypothetical protein
MSFDPAIADDEKESVLAAAKACKAIGLSPAGVLGGAVLAEQRFLGWEIKVNDPIPPEVEKVISVYRQPPGGASLSDGVVELAIQRKIAAFADLVASNEKAFPAGGVDILASPGFQREIHSMVRWASRGVLNPFDILGELARAFGWKRRKGGQPDPLGARRDATRYRAYLLLRQTTVTAEKLTPRGLVDEEAILHTLEKQAIPDEFRARVAHEISGFRKERRREGRRKQSARGSRLTLADRCALWILEEVEGAAASPSELERARSLIGRFRKASRSLRK